MGKMFTQMFVFKKKKDDHEVISHVRSHCFFFLGESGSIYTWIFQICKLSAVWWVSWVKRHRFYTLGRSRYDIIMIYNYIYIIYI